MVVDTTRGQPRWSSSELAKVVLVVDLIKLDQVLDRNQLVEWIRRMEIQYRRLRQQ